MRAENLYKHVLTEADELATNDGILTPDELNETRGGWLVDVAVGMEEAPCSGGYSGCIVCRAVIDQWDETFVQLPRYVRYAVIATLARLDLRIPTYGLTIG